MPTSSPPNKKNGLTPCRLSLDRWRICYADGCYLNYRCPVYRGCYPNPQRDYLPLPAVFILLGPYEAVPVSYHIPVSDEDFDA